MRKLAAGLIAQTQRPIRERRPAGLEEPRDLVLAELLRHGNRREPRPMQDLVRISVADAAEELWIGERPLEAVIGAQEPVAK